MVLGVIVNLAYRLGPGFGILLAQNIFSLFQRLFSLPILLLQLLWRGFTLFFSLVNTATGGVLQYGTGWIQSTFATTEKIQKGIKDFVYRGVGVLETKHPVSRWFVRLFRALTEFVFDTTLQTYKAIPHGVFFLFLVYLWFFTGYPLLFVAAFPQSVSDNLNVYILGGQDYVNVFLYIYNFFSLFANLANPFFQITISFFAQLAVIVSQTLFQSFTFDQSSTFGGGGRQARGLAESQTITQSTSILKLFDDTEFEFDERLVLTERAFLIAESPLVTVSYSASVILITGLEVIQALSPFLQPILDFLVLGGQSGACCFAVDPTGSAIAYCAGKFIAQIAKGFLKLFGISTPEFVKAVDDALLPKTVSGVIPCQCHKVIPPVPVCPPPTYICPLKRNTPIATYEEYRVVKISVEKSETTLTGVGTDYALACPNYIRQQGGGARGRGLSRACERVCHKEEWLVEVCEEEVVYLGKCDTTPPLNYKEEVMAFLKTKPKFITHAQAQHLLHRKYTTPPPVTPVYFPGSEEDAKEEKVDDLDFEKFRKKIEEIESTPFPGCPSTFDPTFESYLFRFMCLALKFYKTTPPDLISGFADKIPPHLQHLSNIRKLEEEHITWFKEKTGVDSYLVSLNTTVNHIVTNVTAQVLHAKLRQEMYERHKHRRNLDPSNPVQSEYPYCEYKCPAGECVKRSEIQLCTTPTNWTLGVTTRYVAYLVSASVQTFDPQFLIESTLSCWKELLANPSKNPATLRGYLEYIGGSDMSSYTYCFPLYKSLPYLPIANFNWNKYINSICTPNKAFKGPASVSQCACAQYITVDVFNYAAWSTIFTPVFVTARLFNAWKAIQWFLVNLPISWFNSLWKGFAIWANPQGSFEIIYAFDYNFALSGQSVEKNWGCSALHGPEVLFLGLLFYLLWILAGYYGRVLWVLIFALLELFFLIPFHSVLNWLTIYLYTTQVVEGKKSKLKLAYEKNLNV